MLITKYDPFQDLKEINKRFFNLSSAFPKLDLDFDSSVSNFVPSVNTREGEFAYHVDVDLPGVKKADIKVDVEDNVLKISGERNFKKEVKKEDYYKVETSFGKFQRNFTLPNNVDAENITATSKDGVLEVILPKVDAKKSKKDTKKIDVK